MVRLVMPGAAEKKGEPSPHLEPALTLAFGSCPPAPEVVDQEARGPQQRERAGRDGCCLRSAIVLRNKCAVVGWGMQLVPWWVVVRQLTSKSEACDESRSCCVRQTRPVATRTSRPRPAHASSAACSALVSSTAPSQRAPNSGPGSRQSRESERGSSSASKGRQRERSRIGPAR